MLPPAELQRDDPKYVLVECQRLDVSCLTFVCIDAIHYSGTQQPYTGTELNNAQWYFNNFLPTMDQYKKGPLVWTPGAVKKAAEQESRLNAIVGDQIYDLTDYFYTVCGAGSFQKLMLIVALSPVARLVERRAVQIPG